MAGSSPRPALAPRRHGGAAPLSFAQQRLWFLERLEPGRSLYSVFRAYRLSGQLSVAALAAALSETARRHEVLRSAFPLKSGQAVQAAAPAAPVSLPVVDLGGLAAPRREEAARHLADQEADCPFDLERGPLLRAQILRFEASRHWLLLNFHHLACDARSFEILLGELGTLYAAGLAGAPSPLPEPKLQYADFACWEAARGEELDVHLPYWRERLAGLPELRLPFDRPRPAVQRFRGARWFVPLGVGVDRVGEAARQLKTTRFTVLLAAFGAFLRRITGQEDLAVGSPFAGRTCPGTEDMIGFFVQTLVLRLDAAGDPGFADLVRRAFVTAAEAQSHQDLPFDRLVRALRPERTLSHNPLFQVLFSVQPATANRLAFQGLEASRVPIAAGTARFDLIFEVLEGAPGEEAALVVEYDRELFTLPTAERLAGGFSRLLAGCLAEPRRPLSELPLLSPAELQQVLGEWNAAQEGEPTAAVCLHELFLLQAERAPDAEALVTADERISYRELARRARGVARRLRALGVGPEVLVGIFAERSAEMVTGMLGTLIAGGAYVPLDPDYPQERVAFLVADAAMPLVLTQSRLIPRLPSGCARVVCLEEVLAAAETDTEDGQAGTAVAASNLAYAIYTSGSTGRPKGVAITHRSAVARMRWARRAFSPEELAGVLFSTSICFDVSIFELFAPLSWGGKILLSRNVLELPHLPARDEVVTVCTVPSAMAELAQARLLPASVRTVNLGGEPVRHPLVERLHEIPGIRRVLNLYGPTEDTTYSTVAALTPEPPGEPAIGRPLPGTRAYVLDGHLAVLPRGAVGQLYLGGDGLSRGYLRRPDLTAERYLPDPLSPLPGQRLYRTGDLVRYRPDGEMECLGRIDHQVKVRGFRVELGEIESALSGIAGVREAAVIAEGPPGAAALAAFYVPDPGLAPAAETLRAALRERLPDYMVPGRFVRLEVMPRTPNGKIDRSGLLAADEEAPRESAGRRPSTPLEELIAGVWSAVLDQDGIGADEDFFDLGGHSLLATRVLARLRESLGAEISLRQFFELRTVADLAVVIERERWPGSRPAAPPLTPAERGGDPPLSFAQERLWFLEELDPHNFVYNLPAVLEIRGGLSPAALAGALSEITRRHEALRTRFLSTPRGPVQRVDPYAPWAPACADLSGLPREAAQREAGRIGWREVREPFDLARGPLLRATLLRLAPGEHRLLLTFHHIVADGWSLALFFDELSALYGAAAASLPSPLPELDIQYPDYALWQREWLGGEVIEEELAHWRTVLAGIPDQLEMPTDRPRPEVQTFHGSTIYHPLPGSLAAGLAVLARGQGATLFMTLLACFEALLHRYSGQDDLVVGTPVANRGQIEIEKLIGFFVNTLALRGDLRGDPSVAALLGRVREGALAAYAHQELPFEKLVAELRPERDLGRTPLFQVILMFQAQAAEFRLPGLEVRPLEVETGAAKIDLVVSLTEEPEGGLATRWTFDDSLFDRATVERMAVHFEQLLGEMAAEPERRLSGLRMLTAPELAQLAAWNRTEDFYPPELTLSRLVAARIASTPDGEALVFEGERWTYRQLGERVAALARHLRGLGVGPDVMVGLFVERSMELVVGIFGVLAAGGAYVPLDPGYPRERLDWMLEDAAPKLLLTAGSLRDRVPGNRAIPILHLDEMEIPPFTGDLEAELAGDAGPDNLSYVIFTSGSTGRPKGVLNTHRGIVNRLLWGKRNFPFITAADRMLQKTTASFDISVWEIFFSALVGAPLVVARPDGHRDPAYLARIIVEERITVIHFVPSMLRLFLAEPDLQACSSILRVLIASGEALPGDLAELCLSRIDARMYNLYGPTEAAVEVTWWPCEPGTLAPMVPIGLPVANTEIHLLDRNFNQAPPGLPAELYVGGVQLARGYLRNPGLTAERFLPDCVSGRAGDRLYRTGDIARYRPDGGIEFLGRADHQVKIRGVRIELGEIETALRSHPKVGEAVVVTLPEPGAGPLAQQLVAYVVPRSEGPRPETAELRDMLRRNLTEAMVPAVFVHLPALPLTPSGKIDRRSLPAPDQEERETVARPPATAMEEILAGVWAEVLGRDPSAFGSEDDFFDLGGHSLLAAQMVARVREIFRCELPLREIFATPTLAALAARIATLASGTREAPEEEALQAAGPEEEPPLSFAQERLWFLEQLRPGSAAYNVPLTLALSGPLDVERLRRACEEIVWRHQALRVRFEAVDGEPVQRLSPPSPLPLPVVDLAAVTGPAGEALATALACEEAGRPFDLARGPLLRLLLLRRGPGRHVLVLNFHHIVADGWSLGIFLREVAALYAGGIAAALPPLPVQYFDFARWQRQRAAELEEQLEFWRRRLAGAPPVLELPADRPRPSLPTYRGEKVAATLPAPVAERLRNLSRKRGVTLYMTLLSAFSALLARLCGQEDLLMGTPVAERGHLATEGLVGLFVNTLTLRCDLSGDPDFGTLQERSRNLVLEAYAHRDLPFERLVQELAPVREVGLPPLVQVMVVLQRSPLDGLALPDLEVSHVPLPLSSARFDLTLSAMEGGARLPAVLEYAADLLDAPSATRWLEHWVVLLEAVAERPELRVSELPLLSGPQRAQLLAEWNDRADGPVSESCVHELFEQAAVRWPERVAVEWEGETLTYSDLAARTARLAAHLRRLGVGPEVTVGLCAERSPDLVVGLLGILRSGGCYLPLDPEYPAERLAYMLGDSAVRVVVTQERLRDRLPSDVHRVELDGAWNAEAAEGEPARPGNLAYVIYTSGSTGRPKGTLVAHRGVVNMLLWRQRNYPVGPEDRVLQTDSFSFDASVWQFFWTLSTGARLVLTRPGGHRDSGYLVDLLASRRITVVGLVPSMLQVVLQERDLERCSSLRHVFCGGEALSLELVAQLCRRLPGLELHNVYGPTEATIDATDATCRGEKSGDGGRIAPIGRPLAHQRTYVLDGAGAPAPPGVPGELYIGGVGLARGYHRQPGLTAERFVPDGVSSLPGERLYRTGDRVRWLTDGRLEFLGRFDHQVKIRGFRIELREIEAALTQHPEVTEAVVVTGSEPGVPAQRLVAYFVPAPGEAEPTAAQLRGFLRATLPEHMVPAAFVLLPALPLTPSGKIDRQALPSLTADHLRSTGSQAPPRTEFERTLAELWKDVLGVDQVGRDDHFFDLGGHSLRATQVVSRVRRTFGVELPLSTLFEAPTLAAFAESLTALRDSEPPPPQPPLTAAPRDGELPLSFAQERLWFLARFEPGSAAYNVPVDLRLVGPLDAGALRAALGMVVARHEALRTRFVVVAGAPAQRVDDVVPAALPVIDLSAVPAMDRTDEAARLATEAARQPFDLAAGPPLRALLLRLGPDEHELEIVLHHLLCDGWSMGILLSELAAGYAAARERRQAALPALPVQYADFAHWQRQWLSGEVLAAELELWRQQLAGADEILALPTDRPRPAVQTDHGATVEETWPESLTAGLRTLCRREGVTPFMAVLAAFGTLLHRYSGQADFLIGTPVANRTRAEIEGLIGLFVNTLVLRARLDGDPDFRTLLARTRETALGAYEHQDLPFEKLVEAMRPRRDLSHPPLFQVLFSLQEETAEPALAGLATSRRESVSGTAKFDLNLALGARGRRLRTSCEYNRDLFDPATVMRMTGHLQRLLAGALTDPERPLRELPLLTGAERQQLTEWNDTARDYGAEACLHELIAEQVARTPEAVAVVCEGASLTYAGLATRVGGLARHLARLGVGPESLVAVAMERSVEMVVALVAVLEAGGAYVPIDPSYPSERLTFMLEDAMACEAQPVLLTQEHVAAALPLDGIRARGGRVLLLDRDFAPVSDDEPLPARALPDGPAYMIYTSGSTGRPKGAINTHRAIINRLLWMQEAFRLGPEDRVLQKTPFSFDVSVWEFFWPLLVGARLVVARPGGHQDARYLAELIEAEGVTTLHFVPSMLQVFLGEPEAARCRRLRRVICSGEALPPELVGRFYQRLPHSPELHNLYGPTEAAVDVTWWRCSPMDAMTGVPIGRPIANIDIHVVDRDFQPLVIGGAGELLLGGVGLARGYHARPALTAERFVPNPFSSTPGSRLYRTGDLARVRTDGAVEYLGRLDHQIKLRGFRIELGEIEAALCTHPGVREAVVVARGEGLEERLIAFIVAAGDIAPEPTELRAHARRALPDYMVPALFVPLASLPLTANGKVDRRALPELAALRKQDGRDTGALSDLERSLLALWRELLVRDDIGRHDSFFDLGGHSLLLIRLQERLEQTLDRRLPIVDLFRFPTIASLAEHLGEGRRESPTTVRPHAGRRDEGVAIVGMAGRFPGAGDLAAFWQNLREGVDSISRFTRDELVAAGVDPELLRDPGYVPAKGVLEGADLFAASFFGYSPREAELMDPQHRVLLECAWECLEDAGHDPARAPGRIGVFAGAAMNTYLLSRLAAHRDLVLGAGAYPVVIGNDKDYVPTRISYRLDLRGPSVLVQTACSTSLVAVHIACRSLLDGECDLALAGGVAVTVPLQGGHLYREGGILSPDGHCRAFDAAARGIVGGNGAGLVALRRLDDALADGDCIRAVIKGSAINNDGRLKVGFTAPSIEGQADVVCQALARAGVSPDTIGYIEAHGTGTPLGDPIEIAALRQVFGPAARHRAFCALGSVKTNIGHLDAAAGVAGLIKTVLALEHRELPPSLHFERPNPELGLHESHLFVNTRLAAWPTNGEPRRAGVSSFGIGGTNAHLVVEEAPSPPPAPAAFPWQILPFSARSGPALAAVASRLASHLRTHPEVALARVAYTLQIGRAELEHRGFVVCRDAAEAAEALATISPAHSGAAVGPEPPVAFLLPGQGSQYVDMGRELYGLEPRFRTDVDRCAEILEPLLGRDLRRAMFLPDGAAREAAERDLEQTELTQPALFTIEYALARLWMSWGVRPQAMLGHSLGELVAATLAGVWSLEDGLALVAERGRLMQSTPPGAMLAVELPEQEVAPLLSGGLSLAAVNAPRNAVVSGPVAEVDALEERLRGMSIDHRRLRVSHAFHSALVDPALEPFEEAVRRVALAPPRIPFLSNVTGTWIAPEQATDPAYWARQVRATVRFSPATAELLADSGRILLEVGPGQSLGALVRRQAAAAVPRVIPSLPRPRAERGSDLEALLTAAGRLWLAGSSLDWKALHADRRPRRAPLPTYPFEKQRFWLGEGISGGRPESLIQTEAELWRQTLALAPAPAGAAGWLLLGADPLARELEQRLREAEERVTVADTLDEDWPALIGRAGTGGLLRVISLWDEIAPLRRLAEALAAWDGHTEVVAVTRRGCSLAGEPAPEASAALLHSVSAELARLHPGLHWRTVDLAPPSHEAGFAALSRQVLAEAGSPGAEPVVAYRGASRWEKGRQTLPEMGAGRIRTQGVYLVLGGLSGPGLPFLEHLAGAGARLVATGPDETLEGLQALETAGAEILRLPDRRTASPRQLVSRAQERFGALHGVFDLNGLLTDGPPSQSVRTCSLTSLYEAVAETDVELVQIHDRRDPGAEDTWEAAASRAVAEGLTRRFALAGGAAWSSVLWDLPWNSSTWTVALPRVLGLAGGERLVVSIRGEGRRRPAVATALTAKATHDRPALANDFIAPTNKVEAAIADIWQELLGLATVGTQDDFFSLGGDSLLATQVIARVRERLGVQISLSSVLEQPTVMALAAACRRARQESPQDEEISRFLNDVASLSTEELEQMLARRNLGSTAPGDLE